MNANARPSGDHRNDSGSTALAGCSSSRSVIVAQVEIQSRTPPPFAERLAILVPSGDHAGVQ
jgi:hypothetical protein